MRQIVFNILIVFGTFGFSYSQSNVVLNKNLYHSGDTIFGRFFIDPTFSFTGPISVFLVDEDLNVYGNCIAQLKNRQNHFYLTLPQVNYDKNLSLQIFYNKHLKPAFVQPLVVTNNNIVLTNPSELDGSNRRDLDIEINISPDSKSVISIDSKEVSGLTVSLIDLNLDISRDNILGRAIEGADIQSSEEDYFSYSFLLLGESGDALTHEKVLLSSNVSNTILYQISDSHGKVEFRTEENLYNSTVHISLLNQIATLASIELIEEKREFETFPPASVNLSQSELDLLKSNRKNLDKIKESYVTLDRKSFITKDSSQHQLLDADYTIDLNDYVQFNSLKEMIKEAIPYVFIKKQELGVFDKSQKRSFPKPPLILVNNVPVIADSVFNLPYEQIDYIQVVNSFNNMVKFGSLAANGVVAIYIDNYLPESVSNTKTLFLNGFANEKAYTSTPIAHAPYLDDCLVWKSFDNPSDATNIYFQTPDYQTTLELRINYQYEGTFYEMTKQIPITHEKLD